MILNRKFSSFFKKFVQNNYKKEKFSQQQQQQLQQYYLNNQNNSQINNNTITTCNDGTNTLTISNGHLQHNSSSSSINDIEIDDNEGYQQYQSNLQNKIKQQKELLKRQQQQQQQQINNNINNNENVSSDEEDECYINNEPEEEINSKPIYSFNRKPKPTLEDGISFNNKIQSRFSKDSDTFLMYINILKKYQVEKLHLIEVYYQISELFKEHQDLICDYIRFLPDEIDEMIIQEKQNQQLHLKQ